MTVLEQKHKRIFIKQKKLNRAQQTQEDVTNLGLRIQQNYKQDVWEPVIELVSTESYVSTHFLYQHRNT